MADFGGFNIETPQEVLARLNKQRAPRLGSSNLGVRTNAEIEGLIDQAFGGGPEVRRARAIEKRITDANEQVAKSQPAGVATFDTEITRLTEVRDSIMDLDPAAANQVNQRILELGITRDEQDRLKAVENRDQTKFEGEQGDRDFGEAQRKRRFVIDTETGAPRGTFDTSDSADLREMVELIQSDPNLAMVNNEDFVDQRAEDRHRREQLAADLAKATAGGSKAVEKRKFSEAAQANFDFALGIEQLLDLVEEAPASFGKGGQAVAGLQRVGVHGQSFVGSLFGKDVIDLNNNRIDSRLEIANIRDAKRRALVIDLAYAIATSREGGRLTDQDVDRAIQTIGTDNPDPRAITEVIDELVVRRAKSWDNRLVLAGIEGDAALDKSHAAVKSQYTNINTRLGRIKKSYSPKVTEAATPGKRKVKIKVKSQ